MNIAIYSRLANEDDRNFLLEVAGLLLRHGHRVWIEQNLAPLFPDFPSFDPRKANEAIPVLDFLISIGGDGTFLQAARYAGNHGIPVVGINTGRVGFLAHILPSRVEEALRSLETGHFKIEERSLLHVETYPAISLPTTFALNDLTIHSLNEISMSAITVWIDGQKVNTYWADGLIVATPTGSTAYSLSCGGPILLPSSRVNVLTPIASHGLTVRPLVVPAEQQIRLSFEGRGMSFILTIDSHRVELPQPTLIHLSPENFTVSMVRFHEMDFFTVLREKLMWGADRRNRS
ncbi:MAG: NAD(+)/NADH kinase [Bacteroidales bacterium]|jgi:NAD+ kinase|nr:NAD(+)/NADH kinase [Bacteroidales bacterium]